MTQRRRRNRIKSSRTKTKMNRQRQSKTKRKNKTKTTKMKKDMEKRKKRKKKEKEGQARRKERSRRKARNGGTAHSSSRVTWFYDELLLGDESYQQCESERSKYKTQIMSSHSEECYRKWVRYCCAGAPWLKQMISKELADEDCPTGCFEPSCRSGTIEQEGQCVPSCGYGETLNEDRDMCTAVCPRGSYKDDTGACVAGQKEDIWSAFVGKGNTNDGLADTLVLGGKVYERKQEQWVTAGISGVALSVSSDGTRVLMQEDKNKLQVFEKSSSSAQWSYLGKALTGAFALRAGRNTVLWAMSADGNTIASVVKSGDEEEEVLIWKWTSGSEWKQKGDQTIKKKGTIGAMSLDALGTRIAILCFPKPETKTLVYDYDSDTNQWVQTSDFSLYSSDPHVQLLLSDDGKRIAFRDGQYHGTLELINDYWVEELYLYEPRNYLQSMALSGDGSTFVVVVQSVDGLYTEMGRVNPDGEWERVATPRIGTESSQHLPFGSNAVALSRNGKELAYLSSKGVITYADTSSICIPDTI